MRITDGFVLESATRGSVNRRGLVAALLWACANLSNRG